MLLSLLLASLLTSAPPPNGPVAYGPTRGIDYVAAQSLAGGRERDLSSASLTTPIGPLGGRPDFIAWGELVVIRANGDMSCALSMTSSVSLGAWNSGDGCTVTDANGFSGPGACAQLGAGESIKTVPKWEVLSRFPGARVAGICTVSVLSLGRTPVYPACRVDGDCTDAGSTGTCDTTLSADDLVRLQTQSGAAIVCKPGTANANVHAHVEG